MEKVGTEVRVMYLDPLCDCGKPMVALEEFKLDENGMIYFVGSCGEGCETNVAVSDTQKAMATLKARAVEDIKKEEKTREDVAKLEETSGVN